MQATQTMAAVNRFQGKIPTALLKKIWRSTYDSDVDRFFPTDEIELECIQPYGFLKFTHASGGDAEFYRSLMRLRGYSSPNKAEFREAAQWTAPGEKVLDVGCGIGNFSVLCRGEYRGVETNPGAVEDAAKLGRNVHQGFVEEEEQGSFDVVTVFQVLEHVDDPESFLKACVGCVRPGGRIILSTPDADGVMGYAVNEILNYRPHHLTWWSETSLRAILKDHQCEVTEVWSEPLQGMHLRLLLSTLFWPRREKHFTSSILYHIANFGFRVLGRIARRSWIEVPFVRGHTVMVMATKK